MIEQLAKQFFYRLPEKTQYILYRNLRHHDFIKWQKKRKIETSGYSLKPFDDYKCIFVRIPKCASRSVSKALFGNFAGGHTLIRKYRLILGSECFRNYFKFTIVRNPWDRLVSAFFFLKRGGIYKSDRKWAEENLSSYTDFEHFVKGWLCRGNVRKYIHFRPQCDFICLQDGVAAVDFIGYYEKLEQDFSYINEVLGIKSNLLSLNVNRFKKGYMEYYSDETIAIVADVYREDIRLLGYNFDSSSLKE